jgi:hypothetical protein
MKITNHHGVPEPLVTLASRDFYSKGSSAYSATELLQSPRIKHLRMQHRDKMTTDVSDMLWTLLGSALHVVAERGETPGWSAEERLFLNIEGTTISGQIDLQHFVGDDVVIYDYKFTSAWAVMNNKVEWEEQLNIYRYLVEKVKGRKVTGLMICAFVRDWSRHESLRPGYPASQITVLDVPLWDIETTEKFLMERLHLHQSTNVDYEGVLPQCTDQDRWMSETIYAVKREGRKSAIRVFKELSEATQLAEKEKGYVETRKGEPRRCTGNWCGVNQWCDQYRAYVVEAERERSHGEEA